jgi:hypothetical protein
MKRAYVNMWIAGTVGAYFSFIFHNLAFDIPTFDPRITDWSHTRDVLIRYVYLFWFLGYFFASNMHHAANDRAITGWHIAFDMIQGAAGFIAAYFLDFLTRGKDSFAHCMVTGVVGANAAIAVICATSLIIFGWRSESKEDPMLNWLRSLGLVTAIAAGIWARFGGISEAVCAVAPVIVSQLILWGLLVVFMQVTIEELYPSATVAEDTEPRRLSC